MNLIQRSYQSEDGYWRIRNPSGVLIPIQGGHQGRSFFVDIKVGVIGYGPSFNMGRAHLKEMAQAGMTPTVT